ncbi:hypothetical protein [Rhizobium mongolense]|uniref:hypothetical protein n=1 Tax=Rhizobium mongolense TaxID=57676 RepID=UPI0034A4B246
MATWIRQRLKQINALVSSLFASHQPSTWLIDNEMELATACSPLEWTSAVGLLFEEDQED